MNKSKIKTFVMNSNKNKKKGFLINLEIKNTNLVELYINVLFFFLEINFKKKI